MRNYAMMTNLRILLLAAAWIAPLAFSGCANMPAPSPSTPVSVPGVAFRGTVHGGQQPVANSRVRIYATGSTGYGSGYNYAAGTDLLGNTVVTTNANGEFSVSGDYTCPSPTTNVYFVVTGGNPISGSPANSNLALMSAFGPCPTSTSNFFLEINELTTVAAVYALAPFMTGPANVGTTSTNAAGLANAFNTVNNLVSTSNGSVPGPVVAVRRSGAHGGDEHARRYHRHLYQFGRRPRHRHHQRRKPVRQPLRPDQQLQRRRSDRHHHSAAEYRA